MKILFTWLCRQPRLECRTSKNSAGAARQCGKLYLHLKYCILLSQRRFLVRLSRKKIN